MRSMCLSLLAERPHAFKQFWGGTFCEGIITPPLLTLNMRDTEEHGSGVKVNKNSKALCAVCEDDGTFWVPCCPFCGDEE
jgi:hypothetical protein